MRPSPMGGRRSRRVRTNGASGGSVVSAAGQALDRIVRRDDDFASVLTALYTRRHTGLVLLHFFNGRPRKIEFPGVQVTLLDEGDLDRLGKLADSTS